MYIFLDCESAGLRGEIFSAAMIGPAGEILFDGWYFHSALETNEWLKSNVLPNLTGQQFEDKSHFLSEAATAWKYAREKYGQGEYKSLAAVAHMGSPVEANFFQEMFNAGLIGEFEGPYPLHDTATLLHAAGYAADSEQNFADSAGIAMPAEYRPHSALSDAELTRLVWFYLTKVA